MKKKEKKVKVPRKKFKQRVIDLISIPIKNKVKEHDIWLVEQICKRIEFLSVQDNFSIPNLILDLKNGGYKND